jgi:hypothetical protein
LKLLRLATADLGTSASKINQVSLNVFIGSIPDIAWLVMRDPTRRILKRGLAALCHPACRNVYLALHHRDRAREKRRRRFMDRVRRAFAEV